MYKLIWKFFAALESFRSYCYSRVVRNELKSMGLNTRIDSRVEISFSKNLSIGKNVYIGKYSTIVAGANVTIGDHCMIAAGCRIITRNHRLESGRIYRDLGYNDKEIRIGSNVWLAYNVVVLPGVVIGDGAVIAAGSIVTNCVPENEIWGGAPARFIKIVGAIS